MIKNVKKTVVVFAAGVAVGVRYSAEIKSFVATQAKKAEAYGEE